jgi:hypothetical protein
MQRISEGKQKKKLLLILGLTVFLSGCIQEREHLTLNKDGSGTLEDDLRVPQATVEMVDSAFGGMVKGFAQAMDELGAKDAQAKIPPSVAEEMFANKDEIFKKAKAAGLNIEMIRFQKEKKNGDLFVQYALKFDQVQKLLKSEILGTQISLSKDSQGNLVCALKENTKKAGESKQQMQQFKDWQDSKDGKAVDKEMEKKITEAMKNFKVEFLITLPNEIKEVNGQFVRKDANTALVEASGDLLTNPELASKLYSATTPSTVSCSGEGLTFNLEEEIEPAKHSIVEETDIPLSVEQVEASPASTKPAAAKQTVAPSNLNSSVKVYFKNGKVLEGKLLEENSKYIKLDHLGGVALTYFQDEIERIEKE